MVVLPSPTKESGTVQLQLGLDVNGRSTAQRGTAGTRSGYTHEDAPGRISRQHIHAVHTALIHSAVIYISSFSSRLSRQIVLFVIPPSGALFSSTTTLQADSVVVSLLMAETSRECRGARIGQR